MSKARQGLVGRTFEFARRVREFVNRIPRSMANEVDARQLLRSSRSVAANYLEAQEGLSRKDFFYRVKVCRKEARESQLWLCLLNISPGAMTTERENLCREAEELKLIFAAIAKKDDTASAGQSGG